MAESVDPVNGSGEVKRASSDVAPDRTSLLRSGAGRARENRSLDGEVLLKGGCCRGESPTACRFCDKMESGPAEYPLSVCVGRAGSPSSGASSNSTRPILTSVEPFRPAAVLCGLECAIAGLGLAARNKIASAAFWSSSEAEAYFSSSEEDDVAHADTFSSDVNGPRGFPLARLVSEGEAEPRCLSCCSLLTRVGLASRCAGPASPRFEVKIAAKLAARGLGARSCAPLGIPDRSYIGGDLIRGGPTLRAGLNVAGADPSMDINPLAASTSEASVPRGMSIRAPEFVPAGPGNGASVRGVSTC